MLFVCKSRKQNLCYALRLSIACLLSKNRDCQFSVKMVTVRFNNDFLARLQKNKSPKSYYGQIIKLRLSKIGIKNFIIVFESGRSEQNLHAHIVLASNGLDESLIKDSVVKEKEILRCEAGKIAPSAVRITSTYKPLLYLEPQEAFLLEKEMKSCNGGFHWELIRTCSKVQVYRSKDPRPVDIGLADYLSKELRRDVLGAGRNYYISQNLNQEMKTYFNILKS